jgi:hypothetical protein
LEGNKEEKEKRNLALEGNNEEKETRNKRWRGRWGKGKRKI